MNKNKAWFCVRLIFISLVISAMRYFETPDFSIVLTYVFSQDFRSYTTKKFYSLQKDRNKFSSVSIPLSTLLYGLQNKKCCKETPKYCFISVFVIEKFRVSQTPQGFYNRFLKAFVCHDCYSIQLFFLHADANSTDILFYIWFFSFREQFFGLSSANMIFLFFACKAEDH